MNYQQAQQSISTQLSGLVICDSFDGVRLNDSGKQKFGIKRDYYFSPHELALLQSNDSFYGSCLDMVPIVYRFILRNY